jgi:hypothetical protein
LYSAQWDADAARDELQCFVIEEFGDEDGIGVVDETGLLKKGNKSVGVKRQYTGAAGKVENCQIGTFLVYVSPQGFAFLDRRLYLPKEWCNDAERRAEAKVPPEVEFRIKPQQAVEMLKHSWELGAPTLSARQKWREPSKTWWASRAWRWPRRWWSGSLWKRRPAPGWLSSGWVRPGRLLSRCGCVTTRG